MTKPWYSSYVKSISKEIEIPDYSLYELLSRTAEKYPNHKAVIDGTEEFTYEELQNAVDRFATALNKRGFRKGDRMAVMLPNSVEYIISYFAILRMGGIVCQVNPMYQPRELEHILQDSEAKWFISYEEQHPKLKEISGFEELIVIAADLGSMHANHLYTLIDEKGETCPIADISPREDVALLQYTGGTTGRSKGVMLTHTNLLVNVSQSVMFQEHILETPGERLFGLSPLFHISGIANLHQSILLGGVYIAVRRFLIENALDMIREYRPTICTASPTIYIAILNHPDLRDDDLHSFKVCVSGAAPLPLDVWNRLQQKTKAQVYEAFGQSESLLSHRSPPGKTIKIGSVGIPLSGTDSKIVDFETGTTEMPIGEPGELLIKGPQVMKGYWGNEKETRKSLREGWLYTGDIATMDEDGYFYIVGRKTNMIIASGYNIYPDEIEEVLYQHPAVVEAAVYGSPDSYRGETVKAALVLKKDTTVTEEEIITWCNERLARYKVPRFIEFRDELPKSAIGKVLRRILIDEEKKRGEIM